MHTKRRPRLYFTIAPGTGLNTNRRSSRRLYRGSATRTKFFTDDITATGCTGYHWAHLLIICMVIYFARPITHHIFKRSVAQFPQFVEGTICSYPIPLSSKMVPGFCVATSFLLYARLQSSGSPLLGAAYFLARFAPFSTDALTRGSVNC